MRPEPMTPIFIGLDCANAGKAIAALHRTRKVRRFMARRLSQLKSIHGLAEKSTAGSGSGFICREYFPAAENGPSENRPGNLADLRRGRRRLGARAAARG